MEMSLLSMILIINACIIFGFLWAIACNYLYKAWIKRRAARGIDRDIEESLFWSSWENSRITTKILKLRRKAAELNKSFESNDILNYDGSSRKPLLDAISLNDLLEEMYYSLINNKEVRENGETRQEQKV